MTMKSNGRLLYHQQQHTISKGKTYVLNQQ